jgi:hypothetical protein
MASAGIEEPFAVVYSDASQPGRQVVLWGGTGEIFGMGNRQRQLDAFFSNATSQLQGGKVSERSPVQPGSIGGLAECGKVSGIGATMTLCAWLGDDALLGFIFIGYSPEKSAEMVPGILAAVATR